MDASCCRQQAARLSLCTVTLLLFISSVRGYVQFEPVLVPHTAETKSAVLGSSKVTYGRFQIEEFHKIARTTEDHNCILPGCQRMGEVLDIQRNNVSNFDRETFGSAPKGSTKVVFPPRFLYLAENVSCLQGYLAALSNVMYIHVVEE